MTKLYNLGLRPDLLFRAHLQITLRDGAKKRFSSAEKAAASDRPDIPKVIRNVMASVAGIGAGGGQAKEKRTYFVPVLDSDNLQCFSDHQKSRITLPKIDQCQLKTHPHEKPVQHRESKAPCPKEERTDFKPSLGKQPQQKHRFFKGLRLPMSPAEALRAFGHHLTEFEREEILDYSEIWYLGLQSPKINSSKSSPQNNGYDDSQTYYLQVLHDHIAYRFEVLDVLGQGIYGQVLKCWDHKEEEFVAIKLLRSKNCFYQYGKKEVKILEVLRKTDKMNVYNVVHMKDNFCFRKHLCITFELLGITLEEKKRANKRLSMSEVRKYTTSLLKCLSLLKKEKIMHCDLKPDNIVLSNENPDSLKVIDFGLSCYEKDAKGNSHIQAVPYCSPEVILGHICGVAIDMWSLGCIIFELCTGHMLFQGWNKAEQLSLMIECIDIVICVSDSNGMLIQNSEKEIQQPRRDDLASMLRTKDPHLLDFIKRCLEWDPKKRMMPDEAMQHPWILQHKESSRSHFSLKRRGTTTDGHQNTAPPDSSGGGSVTQELQIIQANEWQTKQNSC
ncbi:dual specificity tyrosine-phosphorylation-regulated kinase 4-like [Lampris incognitus]|uniref:dual specificity tyrosine-phosphorylation-regulated kinase 4-like n=1 Tax=Lampris incognitus TaxID=2546036 RepID=UPI0024B494C9|nr:dual specificity tyrosine-phosphorylation-regulated kinase 4-like [Lampris incognitus]